MGEREVLLALAERCEQATGPDRELDADIARLVGWTKVHFSPLDPDFLSGLQPGKPDYWRAVSEFTASLDAALTLVPEGLKWACGFSQRVPHNAQVWTSAGFYEGECDSNRAIAVCVAALRARAAEAADE